MNIRDGGRKRTAKRNAFLASRCLRSRPHCSATRNNRDARAFLRFFRCPSSRHFAVSVTGNTRPLAFWHISSLSLFLSITLLLLSGPTWLDLAGSARSELALEEGPARKAFCFCSRRSHR